MTRETADIGVERAALGSLLAAIFESSEVAIIGNYLNGVDGMFVLTPPPRKRVEPFETVRVTKACRGQNMPLTVSPIYDGEGKITGPSKSPATSRNANARTT